MSNEDELRPSLGAIIGSLQRNIATQNTGMLRFLPLSKKKRRSVVLLKDFLVGEQLSSTFDTMRMLVAAGLLHWSEIMGDCAARDAIIPNNGKALAFSACALWPLASIKNFPKEWEDDLKEFSSPPVAALLLAARQALLQHTEQAVFAQFAAELAHRRYARGIFNVLEDLNDPERGAFAFASVLMVSSKKNAPKTLSTQEFFIWIGSAAVTGAIGNAFYDELKDVWSSIEIPHSSSAGSTHNAGDNHNASHKHDPQNSAHRGNPPDIGGVHSTQNSTVEAIADWLSSLFHNH